ncbi:hypothetical protein B8V81_4916 [Paenibacillus pasadenensis]|uniref:Uncharacterized protein n=1 Tax=Paenibacillus pasadenensis TaxID=217090 RepID=A0A2N5N832_9BACL|nr:hypothetical protein B8V81_4916 [Paenibacillus pasadenensis]
MRPRSSLGMPGLERGLIHAAQPRRLAYRIDPLRPKRIAVFELESARKPPGHAAAPAAAGNSRPALS